LLQFAGLCFTYCQEETYYYLDKKDKHVTAIEKDELSWTNLSDLKGWQNELAQYYKIKGGQQIYY